MNVIQNLLRTRKYLLISALLYLPIQLQDSYIFSFKIIIPWNNPYPREVWILPCKKITFLQFKNFLDFLIFIASPLLSLRAVYIHEKNTYHNTFIRVWTLNIFMSHKVIQVDFCNTIITPPSLSLSMLRLIHNTN